MKNLLAILSVLAIFSSSLYAQTSIYLEDFESTPLSVITYAGSSTTVSWSRTNSLQFSGQYSDSAKVLQSDTLFLETNAFDASTYNYIGLNFNHICKVDFFDQAYIEVSDDNGQSWTRLTSNEYQGNANFFNNAFSAIDYSIWNISQASQTPTNNWWMNETFDLSSLIGNSTQSKVRFVLADTDNNGALNNYGWLLDDIEIIGSTCELIPPSISLSGTIYQGVVYNTGPYLIEADVQDASGVDSVWLNYSVNGGAISQLVMQNSSVNIFQATIPSASIGDSICYSIVAKDASNCGGNLSTLPTTSCISFNVRSNPPPVCVGTPISTFSYLESFASFTPGNGLNTVGTLQNNWVNDNNDTHDWWVFDRSTTSVNTGPTNDHSASDANYMYVESSGNYSNETAILNSPCYDLTGLVSPKFSFWYHMYGSTMGSLEVEIYFGGQWLSVMPIISGDQGNQWLFKEIDLTAYVGNIVKLRFKATTGSSFYSDIAIDDIELKEPPANELSLKSVFSPNPLSCSGSSQEYLTVVIENRGQLMQSNIPLAYQLNNGTIVRDTFRSNLLPGNLTNFTFQQSVDMSIPANYSFRFWLEVASDADRSNDSILNYRLSSSPSSTNFPDTTDFENFTVGTPGTFMDGWGNDPTDAYDWFINQGTTPSLNTGPSGDHTTGLGKYLFIEASNNFNVETSVLSKCYNISNLNKPELKFSYHMLGQDMGDLHLDISVNGIIIRDIMPVISGNQGSNWLDQTIDLTPYRGVVKLIFRGMTGSSFTSDISIDDVIVYDAQPVGLNETSQLIEDDWKIYPNPSNGEFTINGLKKNTRIGIYSSLGKLVYQSYIENEEHQLSLNNFSKGIYFIEATSEGSRSTKRIVIH